MNRNDSLCANNLKVLTDHKYRRMILKLTGHLLDIPSSAKTGNNALRFTSKITGKTVLSLPASCSCIAIYSAMFTEPEKEIFRAFNSGGG